MITIGRIERDRGDGASPITGVMAWYSAVVRPKPAPCSATGRVEVARRPRLRDPLRHCHRPISGNAALEYGPTEILEILMQLARYVSADRRRQPSRTDRHLSASTGTLLFRYQSAACCSVLVDGMA
jgi:hypothetical protein